MTKIFCDICDSLAESDSTPAMIKLVTWANPGSQRYDLQTGATFLANTRYHRDIFKSVDLCKSCQAKLLRELADKLSPQDKPVEDNKTENK